MDKPDRVVITDYRRVDSSGTALRWRRKQVRTREANRRYCQRYAATTSGRAAIAERKAFRRARLRQALVSLTPVERARLVAIYAEAAKRTAETGIVHHVDHDVPLALGGLHHPDNLLVVPAALNLSKGARYASTKEFLERNPQHARPSASAGKPEVREVQRDEAGLAGDLALS